MEMKEYFESLYYNEPNKLADIFLQAGYSKEYVEDMFNKFSKEKILLRAEKIELKLYEDSIKVTNKEKYFIPKKYKNISGSKYDQGKDRNSERYEELNMRISKNIGLQLESFFEYDKDNYVMGITRTDINDYDKIFKEGIQMRSGEPWIHDNVQIMDTFLVMLEQILTCYRYKNSRGCFLVKIPKASITKGENDPLPIYYKNPNDGKIYLMPEYVRGYIPYNNGNLGNIIINTYEKQYDYKTEFLLDESVLKRQSYGFGIIGLITLIVISLCIILIIIL